MFKKRKPVPDAFTLSLGGIRTIASFAIAPAVASDRINTAIGERLEQERNDRCWQPGHGQAAQGNCA